MEQMFRPRDESSLFGDTKLNAKITKPSAKI